MRPVRPWPFKVWASFCPSDECETLAGYPVARATDRRLNRRPDSTEARDAATLGIRAAPHDDWQASPAQKVQSQAGECMSG